MPRKKIIDVAKSQNLFLEALSEGRTVAEAATAANISRSQVYKWRKADKEFDEDWNLAYEAGADALAAEAQRRGVNGVDEPVLYQGKICGVVRKYSDTLLMFMLKARDPLRYCDRARTAALMRKWENEKDAEADNDCVARADVIKMLDDLAALKSSTAKHTAT